MPAPDPFAIYPFERRKPRLSICYAECGNPRHRKARVERIAVQILQSGWCCRYCGQPVPLHRRADARYCCEGCRKRAARQRRRYRTRPKEGADRWRE